MSLIDEHGKQISKEKWNENYKKDGWGPPSSRRYSTLRNMLNFKEGDVVVTPKLPKSQQFSIARVSGEYRFEPFGNSGDFRHIVPVEPASVRTFTYRANTEAYMVSSLFSIAKHRPSISFAYNKKHFAAALNLLEQKDCIEPKALSEIIQASLDDAIEKSAKTVQEEIKSWNGKQFEYAIRLAFKNQGYEIIHDCKQSDGKDADVYILVRPPNNNLGLFMPQEIAVQVKKWKQGTDYDNVKAINQLAQWAESKNAQKFVISSASGFTDECKKEAEDKDVILIGDLNTIYFLMGLPNQIKYDH